MNTLDALYSRQVPARGAVGADDATKSAGQGARAGRGQDGFAAALNGQAKGARDGGKNAKAPDEDDVAPTGVEVAEPKAGELEGDPDAAYALLVALFEDIRATVAKPEAKAKTEPTEPADPVTDDPAAAEALLAAVDGDIATRVVAPTVVMAELAGEQPARAADADDVAAAPVAGKKAAVEKTVAQPAVRGEIAAADTPDATTSQMVATDPAAQVKPRAAAGAQAETVATKPDPAGVATASIDAKTEAPARQSTPTRTVDNLADAVRTATQSSPGGDAGAGAGGGEGRRNGDGAGSRAAARADAASAKIENVRTVESRSFAAPSMSGNAEAVIRTLAQAGDALDLKGMVANASAAASAQPATGANSDMHLNRPQTLHTLKIQLNPLELGQVTAVMRLTGEELSVELRVETPEAYRQLSSDSESIVRSLRAQGYGVDQVTVMQAGADRSSAGGQGGQQQSFSSGQQFQSGAGQGSDGAGGSGEGRRGEGSRSGNQQGDTPHETAAPLPGGTGNSDGVYL